MQTFEKTDDYTLRILTTSTKEELIKVDYIADQIKWYEDQNAYNNEKIVELRLLLEQAIKLGIKSGGKKKENSIFVDVPVKNNPFIKG
jgi:hypothetical protein